MIWGGLNIGFYFGTFVGLLKDWLGKPKPADYAAEDSAEAEDPNACLTSALMGPNMVIC